MPGSITPTLLLKTKNSRMTTLEQLFSVLINLNFPASSLSMCLKLGSILSVGLIKDKTSPYTLSLAKRIFTLLQCLLFLSKIARKKSEGNMTVNYSCVELSELVLGTISTG